MDKDCLPNCHSPRCEHSVPYFWPLTAAMELGEQGLALFERNLRFVSEAHKINAPPPPKWATPNKVVLDLDTMRPAGLLPQGCERDRDRYRRALRRAQRHDRRL